MHFSSQASTALRLHSNSTLNPDAVARLVNAMLALLLANTVEAKRGQSIFSKRQQTKYGNLHSLAL